MTNKDMALKISHALKHSDGSPTYNPDGTLILHCVEKRPEGWYESYSVPCHSFDIIIAATLAPL